MSGQVMPMLHLYRNILRAAAHFPSMKRAKIIVEIKSEFHRNKDLTDTEKITQCRRVAERGLSDLELYLPSKKSGDNINLTLKGATVTHGDQES